MGIIMKKKLSDYISEKIIPTPEPFEYTVNVSNGKAKKKFIDRIEKMVRSSNEYRDYIKFLKENMDMDKCIFYQKVCNNKNNRKRISIEIHHAPFTLYDYCATVLERHQSEGRPLNDLLIADDVLRMHYEDKVGLVPVSKTSHEILHAGTHKLFVPLHMIYGNYTEFLTEYEDTEYADILYEKLEREMEKTKNCTPESFDAIVMEFTYINVPDYKTVEKLPVEEIKVG